MASGHISKTTVEAIQIPKASPAYFWDDELTGFGVKVTPGGRRVFLVQYRLGGRRGRTRRVTIGTHGVKTAHEARAEAKKLLGEVQSGRNPAADLDRRRNAEAFGRALDRFLASHVDAKLGGRTIIEYRRLLASHIPANWRARPLDEISRNDISRLHDGLRDTPYAANRLLAVLSKFFNWAEGQGLRATGNPCRHVAKFPEKGRERVRDAAELQRLGNALRAMADQGAASPWIVAAIRLLVLTGARLSEILTLRWDYVDLAGHQLRLPKSKTGRKSVYLNEPAIDVLGSIPRLEGNPYVICGEREGAHLVNLQKAWRRIRKAAGLDDVRLHDLRHTFASHGAMDGLSLPIIGALLGHSQPQTTQRYAHLAADPLKSATARIAGAIADAMSGAPAPATAIPAIPAIPAIRGRT